MSMDEARSATNRCRVVMDIGPAVHQSAGLSRYTERLATHLLREEAGRVGLSLFYNAHSGDRPPSSLADARTHAIEMGQVSWRMRVLNSQLMRRQFRGILPSDGLAPRAHLYHATEHLLPNLPCPTVMTVHDLIFERYPEHHTRRNRLFLKLAMPTFVRAADAVIAVSEHTKRDLMELYRCPAEKIHVIYEGIDDDFNPASPAAVSALRRRYGIARPYLFMMGTLEPRKNHAAALHALARLKANGRPHQLVAAGGAGWLFEPVNALVQALGLADDVIFTGYVPQEDVPAFYTGADCVVMPSLYEGFGFPVLEAMACGTPVVCSDASSLPEVAGDAALLVPPTDDELLAANVERILTDGGLTTTLRDRGLRRAARFRWTSCAQQTADLYVALAAVGPVRSASGAQS